MRAGECFVAIETSERVLPDVRLVDRNPAGAGKGMRSSGNAFQVPIARQAEIETGPNRLASDEHQRQLVLRLARGLRVPQKDFVDRAVVQEVARDGGQARSHDARFRLNPGLSNGSSNPR